MADSNQFKIGDVVRLKSGGPPMTVTSATEAHAECHWFLKEGKPSFKRFPQAALEEATPLAVKGTWFAGPPSPPPTKK